jgi:hypothetical protein
MSDELPRFRFRGGVRYIPHDNKWFIILEIDGVQYLEPDGFDTEAEAMTVYRDLREIIIEKTIESVGPDLQIKSPMWCTYCEVRFEGFHEYDEHLPCEKMPEGGNIEMK